MWLATTYDDMPKWKHIWRGSDNGQNRYAKKMRPGLILSVCGNA